MVALAPHKRALVVTALSLLLFFWCLMAARSDNNRFTHTLHGAHQSERFRQAVRVLNSGRPAGKRVDECGSCHGSRSWTSNLTDPLLPVADSACGQCHAPEGAPSLGRSIAQRAARPAHQKSLPASSVMAIAPTDALHALPVRCASCHPDHEGRDSVTKTDVDGTLKIAVQTACVTCHVPDEGSSQAQKVLKNFQEKHSSAFANPPKTADPGTILFALKQQADAKERTCTPACHDEHTPQYGDDQ